MGTKIINFLRRIITELQCYDVKNNILHFETSLYPINTDKLFAQNLSALIILI